MAITVARRSYTRIRRAELRWDGIPFQAGIAIVIIIVIMAASDKVACAVRARHAHCVAFSARGAVVATFINAGRGARAIIIAAVRNANIVCASGEIAPIGATSNHNAGGYSVGKVFLLA